MDSQALCVNVICEIPCGSYAPCFAGSLLGTCVRACQVLELGLAGVCMRAVLVRYLGQGLQVLVLGQVLVSRAGFVRYLCQGLHVFMLGQGLSQGLASTCVGAGLE